MTDKQKFRLTKILISATICVLGVFMPLKPVKIGIFVLAYIIAGHDVITKVFKNIAKGKVMNEKFLMTVATLGAFIVGEYPEAAGVMIFYQVGELFESIATGKSRNSIKALLDLKPDVTTVLKDDKETVVPTDEVASGEIILIKAGERIPLDGIIIEGNTSVDTSSITGEALPQDKTVGDSVFSGTVNLSGAVTVKVTSIYREGTLAKILELTEKSAEKKAKTESFITRFARYYTPIVVYSALALAIIPSVIWGDPKDWIYRALSFLVVSCPCALVVSVPLSFFGGIGSGAKKGILIKGSQAIEKLACADTAVFDKTGTLTTGEFKVTKVFAVDTDEESLLYIAAAAEKNSNHPIAKCICREVKGENPYKAESVTEAAGMGIKAQIGGETYYFGNAALMEKAGADYKKDLPATAVHIAKNSDYKGYILAEDIIKPEATNLIKNLKALGIKNTVMLTGDNKSIAHKVADKLGVDTFKSQLLPQDKVSAVEELIENGHKVIFAGDGINDAPVLARSHVGITMGALGSDAAIEASDVVIMDDNLKRIPQALKLSRRTLSIARQNIIFSIAVKLLILILSATGNATMWLAVIGDVGVLVIAILNSLRTLK